MDKVSTQGLLDFHMLSANIGRSWKIGRLTTGTLSTPIQTSSSHKDESKACNAQPRDWESTLMRKYTRKRLEPLQKHNSRN